MSPIEQASGDDAEILGRVPIFSSLGDEDRAELARSCTVVTREAGEIVFARGDAPRAMYIVLSGRIAISVWGENHQEIILSVLRAGDFFGEVALFGNSARTANARALEPTELLEVPGEGLFALLRRRPELAMVMLADMAGRVRNTTELLEHPVTKNANEEIEERLSFGDRVSDRIAQFGGSWRFILSMLGFLFAWIAVNLWFLSQPFDPFPFILMNLFLSLLAGLQAPIIMMSQNRQAVKDRLHAELDYKVNLKSELQIQGLHLKIDELRGVQMREVSELQRSQIAVLQEQVEMLNRLLQSR